MAPLVGNKAVKGEERGVRIHLQTKTSTTSFLPGIYGVISALATKLYSTLGYVGYSSCDLVGVRLKEWEPNPNIPQTRLLVLAGMC